MRSHTYHLTRADWASLLLPPCLVMAGIVLAMRLWASFDAVPLGPITDLDSLILAEKERAAAVMHDAEILLTGDSSCLMDFSAPLLDTLLRPHRTFNLGTMSSLRLERHGELAAAYLVANSNRVTTVVLLVTPEMVGGTSVPIAPVQEYVPADPEMRRRLREIREESAQNEFVATFELVPQLSLFLALPLMKTQIVHRVFETPWKGPYGWQYGSPSGFQQHLRAHNGSAIDPVSAGERSMIEYTNKTNYEITEAIKPQCEAFRAKLPKGIRLLVGLTPVPQSNPSAEYVGARDRILGELAKHLDADAQLLTLPTVMPDQYFSTTTHLNERGARLYTHILARALKLHLGQEKREGRGRMRLEEGESKLGGETSLRGER